MIGFAALRRRAHASREHVGYVPQQRSFDRDLALRALLGMVNHTAQWFRPRGRLSAEQIADGYVDLLLGH